MRQDKIFLVIRSPLNPDEKEINGHLARHGDGIKDVAFTVDDAHGIFTVRKGDIKNNYNTIMLFSKR